MGGGAERVQALALGPRQVCRLVDEVLRAYSEPTPVPRPGAEVLPIEQFLAHVWAGKEAPGVRETGAWLLLVAQARQRNRAALGALLWAARQCVDVLPPELSARRGEAIQRALMYGWGVRRDVPRDLPACRQLAEAFGTPRWAELSRPQPPARAPSRAETGEEAARGPPGV